MSRRGVAQGGRDLDDGIIHVGTICEERDALAAVRVKRRLLPEPALTAGSAFAQTEAFTARAE